MMPTPIAPERSAMAYALRYAQVLGYHVLPLLPRSKKPHGAMAPNGFKDATTYRRTRARRHSHALWIGP